ncbi:hypothetical protein MLD56_16160 [Paenibacillus peoriae]|uniref:hypothetical protein n=1 Tax=Paenibacillus peoriae TaxID=59893 RepID=UPI001F1443A0|nr:hypothetical protein [Paenibacillus peoriae]UMY53107.1 hypothetical protein MLD56_16160 [Paenibacillus peoriae]
MKIVTSILLTAAFLTLAACSPKQAATTNDTKPTTTATTSATTNGTEPTTTTATTSATTNGTEPTTTTATTSATTNGTEPTTTTATTSATTNGTEPTTTTATTSATTNGTEPTTTTATTSATTNGIEPTTTKATTSATPVDQKQEDTFTPIKKGETVTIQDYADIEVTGHKISKEIESSNAAVSYEPKKEDSTLLALIIEAKNLSAEWMEADKFAEVSLKYDNKYDYDTFSAIEFSETLADDTKAILVGPLDTGKLYYIAEIPDEVAKSDKPLKAEIKVKDKIYEYSIR